MSSLEVPSVEQGVLTIHQPPQPEAPMPGRQVPITPGYEDHLKCIQVRRCSSGASGIPLQCPMHRLTHTQIHSLWVPVLGKQLKKYQGHKERN